MDLPPSPPPAQRQLTLEELAALALGHNGPEPLTLSELYLRINGRVARRTFWLYGVLWLLVALVFGNALFNIAGFEVDSASEIVSVLLVWPLFAMAIKRLHDFNRTGWWSLVMLVPGIQLVVVLVLGIVPGSTGANDFGPDPRSRTTSRFNIVH